MVFDRQLLRGAIVWQQANCYNESPENERLVRRKNSAIEMVWVFEIFGMKKKKQQKNYTTFAIFIALIASYSRECIL